MIPAIIKLLKPFVKKNKIAVYGSRYFNKSLFSFNFYEKEKQSFLAFIFNFFLSSYFLLFGKCIIQIYLLVIKFMKKFLKLILKYFETDHEITINLFIDILKKKKKKRVT